MSGPGNSTKHVELDIRGTGLYYGTADDLSILPENDPTTVATFARWLGFDKDLDRWFTLEPSATVDEAPKLLFPMPTTVRKALTCYCDLTGLPSKQLMSYLGCYAQVGEEVSLGVSSPSFPPPLSPPRMC